MYLKRGERKPIVTSSLYNCTQHWGEAEEGGKRVADCRIKLTCSSTT